MLCIDNYTDSQNNQTKISLFIFYLLPRRVFVELSRSVSQAGNSGKGGHGVNNHRQSRHCEALEKIAETNANFHGADAI